MSYISEVDLIRALTFIVALTIVTSAQAQNYVSTRETIVCVTYNDAFTVREMAIAGKLRSADFPYCVWVPKSTELTYLRRLDNHIYGAIRLPNGPLVRVWADQSDWD